MSATTSAVPKSTVAPQGGILDGLNPIKYSDSDPIKLFIIQACIIIIICRMLHYPLSKLAQPRVIAEVIGGIVLGPSVMMRIPGFRENIFPEESMSNLSTIANLGLLLFLFLVGLEVDMAMFRSNVKIALYVSLAGLLLPFALGYAVAWGLYNEYRLESNLSEISFGTYGLFIGTALSITAFPVLCRILSELRLLVSPVGVTVIAAGIGNDVVGWVLLALSVALVNNGSGLTALYVTLTAIAWVLFVFFAVRPAFVWVLRRTGSLQHGPSQGVIALTIILVLISGWFTAAIGVHAIFGAFLIGLICPHDGGFAIKITEKIEDFVHVFLLPLFFALFGMNTDLGLLNDGTTWGYVIAVICIAFFGKVVGGALAARLCKLLWRESFTIGVLMSCKGVVELIVLNIGLQAAILSQRTFTIFVIMTLVTTVATTPLAKLLYPMSYRKKVELWKRGEIDWDGNPLASENQLQDDQVTKTISSSQTSRVLVQLRLDSLHGLFGLVSMLGQSKRDHPVDESDVAKPQEDGEKVHPPGDSPTNPGVTANSKRLQVRGLHLVELTDRTSSVMQSLDLDEYTGQDFVCLAFRAFSQLHRIASASHVATVLPHNYAAALDEEAKEVQADMTIVPWSYHGSLSEDTSIVVQQGNSPDRFTNRQHIDFVQDALSRMTCMVGIFISRNPEDTPRSEMMHRTKSGLSIQSARDMTSGLVLPLGKPRQVLLLFIGGADDQAALVFALGLARSTEVNLTVAHIVVSKQPWDSEKDDVSSVEGKPTMTSQVQEVASPTDAQLLATARRSSVSSSVDGHVSFIDVDVGSTKEILDEAEKVVRGHMDQEKSTGEDLVIVGNRHPILNQFMAGDLGVDIDFQKTIGALGGRMAKAGVNAGILVIRAGL